MNFDINDLFYICLGLFISLGLIFAYRLPQDNEILDKKKQ